MIVRVDVDETICTGPTEPRDYEKSQPIVQNIDRINRLYDAGHTIIYWTARGSRTGKNWHSLTEKQLKEWGAKYHVLECTKPYYDLLIDDKAFTMENLDDLHLASR